MFCVNAAKIQLIFHSEKESNHFVTTKRSFHSLPATALPSPSPATRLLRFTLAGNGLRQASGKAFLRLRRPACGAMQADHFSKAARSACKRVAFIMQKGRFYNVKRLLFKANGAAFQNPWGSCQIKGGRRAAVCRYFPIFAKDTRGTNLDGPRELK